MKRLVMAFSGPSNSGKTTVIEKIAKNFMSKGFKVAIIKHDPKDKVNFDVKGKDSFRFFESGADVLVLSPSRSTFFSHKPMDIDESLKLLKDFDIILIEGLKSLKLPRISVFFKDIDESYFSCSMAIASYEKVQQNGLVWLHLDDIDGLCAYILKNAKEIN